MRESNAPNPLEAHDDRNLVKEMADSNMKALLRHNIFEPYNRDKILSSFDTYYAFANMYFNAEESLRARNVAGANLFYHNRSHAVEQTTLDAINLTREILERNDKFSAHLTAEGAISIVLGAMFHDTGYVSDGPVENYAARTPIHVDESIKTFKSIVNLLGIPEGLDTKKINLLGSVGIHGTHFPFTQTRLDESKNLMKNLSIEERKEAQIVRLATQLADLGGQCARKDYYPTLIKLLRDELNSSTPELGNKVIGKDNELKINCEVFLDNYVRRSDNKKKYNQPKVVEVNAIALLGQEKSQIYRKAWLLDNHES